MCRVLAIAIWLGLIFWLGSCIGASAQQGAAYAQVVGGYHGARLYSGHADGRRAGGTVRARSGVHLGPGRAAPAPNAKGKAPAMNTKALVVALAVVATSAMADVKADLKAACTPDAMILCSASIPSGAAAVTTCMKQNWGSVSGACKAAVEANHASKAPVKPTVTVVKKVPVVVPLPKINLPPVVSPVEVHNQPQETPMNWYSIALNAAALLGAGTFVYYVGKLGLSPVWTKLVGAAAVAKTDFAALEARVKALEGPAVVSQSPAPKVPPAA